MIKHFMSKAPKNILPPISDVKSDQPALQEQIVHGYDSGELFREDLWLRRIEQSRRQIVAPDASTRLTTGSLGVHEGDLKRIWVMLSQYAGTKVNKDFTEIITIFDNKNFLH